MRDVPPCVAWVACKHGWHGSVGGVGSVIAWLAWVASCKIENS